MSYYVDLFLRPKQAVNYALQNPSMIRSIAFVLLGTFAGVLASLLLQGAIFMDIIIGTLFSDFLRWIVSGFLLLVIGLLFKKIPINALNISRALSTLSQISVYGFFMLLVLGLILPAIAFPALLSGISDWNAGNIGEDEFIQILDQSFVTIADTIVIALPLILLGLLFIFYSAYVLFLSIEKYLDTSVFKSILVWVLVVSVQGAVLIFLSA
ncbi:MAG: hypothetical protein FJY86_01165 [Candidatus Diapherotrites archaeon]|uniref:Yip1 domain-containing protein n=1 Tax=Candidatus Iainarchaeum sp. TaxID=3101447 RepID=A0A8T4C6K8_9ARCH|nr:hypothetical protein [Candidatus Diapherotrites archaeon]